MGWVDSLQGSIVGLDTTPLIYFTEEHPIYLTPDSIQLATAIVGNASFFLTNDKRFPLLPDIKLLLVNDLLKDEQDSQQAESSPEEPS